MGMTSKTSPTIQDALFSSVQQRVLGILFGQPDRQFQSAEIIRMASSGTGAVHRQLSTLAASGLLNVTRIGNQKHYQANPNSPVYDELCGLIRKTVGLVVPIRDALEVYRDQIDVAFVYGSVARNEDSARSDIDLMIFGDELDYVGIYKMIKSAEDILHRPLNPKLTTLDEWRKKISKGNSFIAKVAKQPKLFIYGSDDDLS
jgi:predicted nucleotidyltransferase